MTTTAELLSALYEATSEKTLAAWLTAPDCGAPMHQPYYDPHKLALATGFQPAMPEGISALRHALASLTQGDERADVLPPDGFHFTFLPVTLPLYEQYGQPEDIAPLLTLWQTWRQQQVQIRDLRLVALPGQLLLAGIPDEESLRSRQAFCEALLASPWRDRLIARHAHTPLPPPFWHTTLLRYRAQFLPLPVRHFFMQHRHQRFGSVAGGVILAQVNYNWTQVYPC
ncbi:hypothetical protein KXR87_15130 [Yokenella regensburgei]|uniref:hypothetical protein n=1 Tax=Yokenella regensburgei TaxID=158877 RepID=UPI003F1680BC